MSKERAFEDPKPGASYYQAPGPLQPGLAPSNSPRPSSDAGAVGPNPLGPPSSLDPCGTMMSDGKEGYDYAFEPPLDSKYECPICLMCLREPVQTECGHRFCRNCITRSLRDASQRCPVDNKPLNQERVFPDVCVNREILDLMARCPYQDCPDVVELRNMDVHQENCQFGTLLCPQKCGMHVRRRSIEGHIWNSCPKRRVLCDHCSEAIPLDELQSHLDECLKAPVSCTYCNESMLKEQLHDHLKTSCPQVVVDCRYKKVGCIRRMARHLMAEHIETDMQLHMDLLANKFDQLEVPAPHPSVYSQYRRDAGTPPPEYSEEYPGMVASTVSYPYTDTGTKDMGYHRTMSEVDTIASMHHSKYPIGMSMGARPGQGTGLQRHPSNVSDSGDPRLSTSDMNLELEVGHLKEKVQSLQRNIAQQNQEIIMLKANAERSQQDAKRTAHMFGALESRLCNGEFYWKLKGYGDMCREAQRGETSVRHSKGFYTSFYGYKLCLRVNINVLENSHNSHVSIFVHFLRGEFDDFLDWPFNGKITLTIMDQNGDSSKRKHISETLLSKPDLAAFHRPRTHRNHKGFGYMEFAPVTMLDAGTYIKEDCLLIRVLAEVKKS